MKGYSFRLICGKCNKVCEVDSLVFRVRKAHGLPHPCKNCEADLVTTGVPAPKTGRSDSQKRSRLQEKRAAARLGGKVQPGSGAGRAKSDVRVNGKLRVECKLTRAASYSLKLASLQKLEREMGPGENPVFEVEFQGEYPHLRYVVIPGWFFDYLLAKEKDCEPTNDQNHR